MVKAFGSVIQYGNDKNKDVDDKNGEKPKTDTEVTKEEETEKKTKRKRRRLIKRKNIYPLRRG